MQFGRTFFIYLYGEAAWMIRGKYYTAVKLSTSSSFSPHMRKREKEKGQKSSQWQQDMLCTTHTRRGGVSFFFCECEFELSCRRCDGRGGTEGNGGRGGEKGRRRGIEATTYSRHWRKGELGLGLTRTNKLFQFFYQFWGAYGRR